MGATRGSVGKRKPSYLQAVTQMDILVDYTIQITSNHTRFPKTVRYTITDRLINLSLAALGHVRIAAKTRIHDEKSYKRARKHLQRALDSLVKYEGLMVIANKHCKPSNFDYWAATEETVYNSITAWISMINRQHKSVKAKRKKQQEPLLDKDGYMILKFKDETLNQSNVAQTSH